MFIDLSENIDTYIEQFIALYENADADKTVNRATDDLLKEIESIEAKKDKLLDLYTEDAITKTEFKTRNDRLAGEITRLKTHLTDMHRDTVSKSDMVKNVRNIRKAFDRELETNDGKLDLQTVNDLSDMLIDTITVFPKEGSTMRIEVRLKLGMTEEREYVGVMPRSGIIMKAVKPPVLTAVICNKTKAVSRRPAVLPFLMRGKSFLLCIVQIVGKRAGTDLSELHKISGQIR